MSARRRVLTLAAACAALVLLAGCRAAGSPEPSPNVPSSTQLVESPGRWDGTEVRFTGEVIGEAMVRGKKAWLHVNDDAYYLRNTEEGAELGGYNTGMPVWIDADLTEAITYFGDHAHEGDVVTVRGTFNASCPEHGGDTDIHAEELTVVRVGHPVVEPLHPEKIAWAVGLSVLAAALWLLERNWDRLSARPRR